MMMMAHGRNGFFPDLLRRDHVVELFALLFALFGRESAFPNLHPHHNHRSLDKTIPNPQIASDAAFFAPYASHFGQESPGGHETRRPAEVM